MDLKVPEFPAVAYDAGCSVQCYVYIYVYTCIYIYVYQLETLTKKQAVQPP